MSLISDMAPLIRDVKVRFERLVDFVNPSLIKSFKNYDDRTEETALFCG